MTSLPIFLTGDSYLYAVSKSEQSLVFWKFKGLLWSIEMRSRYVTLPWQQKLWTTTNRKSRLKVYSHQPSPQAFSLAPLSARSLGKSGRENAVLGVSLSVTSQLTVESRIDRAENAQGLGCIHTILNFTDLIKFHLICQIFAKFSSGPYLSLSKLRKRKLQVLYVSTYSLKRALEIRKFHVVVVQPRQRNVQNSVMHVQCC